MLADTEVVVIDSPQGAPWALGAHRPRHERSHVLCRNAGEPAGAFCRRVMRRLRTIRRGAEVASLTLVLGSDPSFNALMPELTEALAAMVSPSGFFTLVGVGTSQAEVALWFDSLRGLVAPTVALGASFPDV